MQLEFGEESCQQADFLSDTNLLLPKIKPEQGQNCHTIMTFNQFVHLFPEATLPVSITEESASEFSLENDPLPQKAIDDFLLQFEPDVDDLTEFVPGFRIPGLNDVHALLYWKAGLLNYQYVLATFEKNGKLIDRQVIAGTASDGTIVVRTVAQIDEDRTIYMVSGAFEGAEEEYDASQSTAKEMELLPDGRMIELV